jgi:hypothetical protein
LSALRLGPGGVNITRGYDTILAMGQLGVEEVTYDIMSILFMVLNLIQGGLEA